MSGSPQSSSRSGRDDDNGTARSEALDWTVVCFAGIDYRTHHQRPQAVARDLAGRGAAVVYVDNLGLRLPGMRDARRVTGRMADWSRETIRGGRPDRFGVTVYSPLVPPLQQFGAVRALARRRLLRRLRTTAAPGRPLIVWTYLPHPVIREVSDALGASLLVYDWADDASEHLQTTSARHRERVRRWEDEMAERADFVFVASEELLARRRPLNQRVHRVPHGAAPLEGMDSAPAAVTAAPGPRIVLVGSLSRWIDVDLLAGIADARPDWTLILVGPRKTRLRPLAGRPNVVLVGERPYSEVPAILRACDVALIPYRRAPATVSASPVKLWDYLAHGLPVVSVDVPEVRRQAGEAVEIAEGTAGFVAAIGRALERGRADPSTTRSWTDAVSEMVGHLSAVVGDTPVEAATPVPTRTDSGPMLVGRTVLKTVSAAADLGRRRTRGVVVLLYHRVGLGTRSQVDIPESLFDEHMAMLGAGGRAASLERALAALDLDGPDAVYRPDGDPVVVTFDDGTADFVDHALPVLERWGIPATLYVSTRFIDEGLDFPRGGTPLSWEGLAEATSTDLVTIGSHTHSHRLLDRVSNAEVDDELDRSISLIGEHLGVRAGHFAYPKAVAPSPYAESAVRARFRSAALAGSRANPYGATDPYRLSRTPVQIADGVRWFRRKLDGGMSLEGTLRATLDRHRYRNATT